MGPVAERSSLRDSGPSQPPKDHRVGEGADWPASQTLVSKTVGDTGEQHEASVMMPATVL